MSGVKYAGILLGNTQCYDCSASIPEGGHVYGREGGATESVGVPILCGPCAGRPHGPTDEDKRQLADEEANAR